MTEPMQRALHTGDGRQAQNALHDRQRLQLQFVPVRVLRQCHARENVPEHIGDGIESRCLNFGEMAQDRRAAGLKNFGEEIEGGGNAGLSRGRWNFAAIKPAIVANGPGVQQVGQALRDLVVGKLLRKCGRGLEQARQIADRRVGLRIPIRRVRIEIPRRSLKPHFLAEGMIQPYAAGEWGPDAADRLMERDGRRWRRL